MGLVRPSTRFTLVVHEGGVVRGRPPTRPRHIAAKTFPKTSFFPPLRNVGLGVGVWVRVTKLVEPILVSEPSLVSRVDLAHLASKQQAASKQAASTREMEKNHSSVVVLGIRPKFWWMLPMGVRDNHTKYEPETQRWRPGTGVASAGPPFQNLRLGPKSAFFFFAQNRPRTC